MNILVLCTGNSARSILLETMLNHHGAGRVKAYSAGSNPTGEVNPGALEILQQLNYDTSNLRSKSWDEFAVDGAPQMDLVITVCDNAAGEPCPIWPGAPIRHHFGIADPANYEGDAQNNAFRLAYLEFMEFVSQFFILPFDHLPNFWTEALENGSREALQSAISEITPRKGANG